MTPRRYFAATPRLTDWSRRPPIAVQHIPESSLQRVRLAPSRQLVLASVRVYRLQVVYPLVGAQRLARG